jgi:ribulose-5-phosphate 4-epimerase/fuculose-1-phosphate aldolase
MITEQDIQSFIGYAHKVGQYNLTVCSSGNLSWKIDNQVLMSGTGSWVPEIKKENIAVLNLEDGKLLSGPRPSMEHVFHLGVLQQRKDVNVVLHFQSPYATAIACRKDLPKNFNLTAEVPCHVGNEIAVVPYFRPGSKELANAVIQAMQTHNSVLLRKHGQVTCGKDFNQAFERAMFFEMVCRILVLNGDNIDPLTKEEVEDINKIFLNK